MSTKGERVGQTILPGMAEAETLDLEKQQTFAHMAQPRFWGVEPRFLSPEDHHAIRLLDAERLLPSLVGLPRRSSTAASYPEAETGRLITVALSPAEFSIITHSPWHLGERAVNQARAARPQLSLAAAAQASEARSQRAGMHAVSSRSQKMGTYLGQLEYEIDRLAHFSEYVLHRDFRRLRGDSFKEQMGWLRHHVFSGLLEAAGIQRGWKPHQRQRAEQAMDDRLFLDRAHNRHLQNWQNTFGLAKTYWGHKWALFRTKIHEAEREAVKYQRAAGE